MSRPHKTFWVLLSLPLVLIGLAYMAYWGIYFYFNWRGHVYDCVPVSATAGVKSEYIYGGLTIFHWMELTGTKFDEGGNEVLYQVPAAVVKARAPHLLPLLRRDDTGEVFGLASASEHGSYLEGWYTTLAAQWLFRNSDTAPYHRDAHGLAWMYDREKDYKPTYWVLKDLKQKLDPATVRMLGYCPFRQEPPRDPQSYGYASKCDFEIYWRGMAVSYDIRANYAHRYAEIEDFLKEEVLCVIGPDTAPGKMQDKMPGKIWDKTEKPQAADRQK